MAAQRPAILAALQSLLKSGVPAVSNRVYLPWDNIPELENAPMIQIAVEDAEIDTGQLLGPWVHKIRVRIGFIKTGKFDHQAAWDIVAAAATAISAGYTLGGLVESINLTGAADHLETAGDRILWPHLTAEIIYRTDPGAL